ncbi:hypothetical protein [Streptomyces europaeiscabiei]|uniref:hypothetical protein n=1 Tax=Streptomyces europaeiscabiei TaxID=146819 RepID=UPI002E15C9AB|nr:hypothetical protein OHB30_33400 [Streptomyces europaeiscabiei]
MTGTSAGLRLIQHGYAVLPQSVNLRPGPRTIRLEASRINLQGASIQAGIGSDTVSGRTTLRYERIA